MCHKCTLELTYFFYGMLEIASLAYGTFLADCCFRRSVNRPVCSGHIYSEPAVQVIRAMHQHLISLLQSVGKLNFGSFPIKFYGICSWSYSNSVMRGQRRVKTLLCLVSCPFSEQCIKLLCVHRN